MKRVVWGGSGIGTFKGIPMQNSDIGESWEISGYEQAESVVDGGEYDGKSLSEVIAIKGAGLVGESVLKTYGCRFPLIVKIIDARRNLSVQVHPDDAAALEIGIPYGKTEMWYVLESNPYSSIYAGFNRDIIKDELQKSIKNLTVMSEINNFHGSPGDAFFLPAGQIHAIGEGNMVLEVQQNCDCTYRIFDYGRLDSNGNKRQLHIKEAINVLSLKSRTDLKIDRSDVDDSGVRTVCKCRYFTVEEVLVKESRTIENRRDSFMILFCCEGKVTFIDQEGNKDSIAKGHTILYPATSRKLEVSGSGKLLKVTI